MRMRRNEPILPAKKPNKMTIEHGIKLNQNTPIILCRKLACERLLCGDEPLSIRSQASFLQCKRLKLTQMCSVGASLRQSHRVIVGLNQ